MIGHNVRNVLVALLVIALNLATIFLTIRGAVETAMFVGATALVLFGLNLLMDVIVGRKGNYNPFETPSMFFYATGIMTVVVFGYATSLTFAQ